MLTGKLFDASRRDKTIIVSGLARGGTSMVSAVLRGLGVSMGQGLNNNHEDIDFYSVLNHDSFDIENIRHLIQARNSVREVWGFKSPLLIEKDLVEKIVPEVRNPLVILVFRNAVGNTLSFAERDGIETAEGFKKFVDGIRIIGRLVETADYPILGVSYEQAATYPRNFTRHLVEVAGIDAAEEVMEGASHLITGSGGGYVFLPEEHRTVELLDALDAQMPVRELPAKVDMGSVAAHAETYIFHGDIFDGEDQLIRFTPLHDDAFGRDVCFRVVFGVNSYDIGADEMSSRTLNIYFLLGAAYTLGVSFTMSYNDFGRFFRVRTLLPLRGLAIGISDGKEKGVRSPVVSLEIFEPVDR